MNRKKVFGFWHKKGLCERIKILWIIVKKWRLENLASRKILINYYVKCIMHCVANTMDWDSMNWNGAFYFRNIDEWRNKFNLRIWAIRRLQCRRIVLRMFCQRPSLDPDLVVVLNCTIAFASSVINFFATVESA